MKKFALMGAAGFIAPRHLKAIKETNNQLLAAYDPNDSVGIIDSFFPQAHFFTEFERFDRHLEKLRIEKQQAIDYISICTPNYLHDAHVRFALRNGADAICEKPLVLNPWNAEKLIVLEENYSNKINTILQLRLHPSIIALKEKIKNEPSDKIHDIDLTYITSRGNWYYASWKSAIEKSGGICSNIGIHFFDMLIWIFGDVEKSIVHVMEHDRASGVLHLKNANVRWFLSINSDTLPQEIAESGQRTFRTITIDKQELEFSAGFTDLHTESYKHILAKNGFGISKTLKSLKLAHELRHAPIAPLTDDFHPFAKLPLSKHPFS
ncbi:Gfo/Idh/MocA family protein [Thalassobellus suaedae]|uniref:Gfo/Idh/MocA family oxidoreductase n=1 Tax=Thalassobellus suaedae TaxID=3074124 RepID=A0ABY9XQB2_9FLAO|nr:Gfo/Idh/MocA family oxidoreductase [Flavobacteriaceae bacterium HL-DH14]